MRYLLPTFVLSCFLFNVSHAALTLVTETKEGIVYVDLDSAEKNGDLIKVHGSQDFHRLQNLSDTNYLSAKFVNEFHCEKKEVRQISLSVYPENMANGEVLKTDTEIKPWSTPATGSPLELMLKKVCINH